MCYCASVSGAWCGGLSCLLMHSSDMGEGLVASTTEDMVVEVGVVLVAGAMEGGVEDITMATQEQALPVVAPIGGEIDLITKTVNVVQV